jgi:hypothetical protein
MAIVPGNAGMPWADTKMWQLYFAFRSATNLVISPVKLNFPQNLLSLFYQEASHNTAYELSRDKIDGEKK